MFTFTVVLLLLLVLVILALLSGVLRFGGGAEEENLLVYPLCCEECKEHAFSILRELEGKGEVVEKEILSGEEVHSRLRINKPLKPSPGGYLVIRTLHSKGD